jgi:protein-disulfide isomerase
MPPQRPRKKRAPARRPRPWVPVAVVGTAAILAVVLIVVFSNVGGGSSSNSGPAATPGPTHAAAQSGSTVGSDSAPVTMVEYFRFDCPHCADFAAEVEPQLERDYIDTGKLRIEFHPLALEGDILNASAAALCAGEQGRFWEYCDLAFANINRAFSKKNLRQYAGDLGLDRPPVAGAGRPEVDDHVDLDGPLGGRLRRLRSLGLRPVGAGGEPADGGE